ncbi:MAG: hypothetical protein PHC61_10230 [Chitinivibrionales bacterium]|nr:hypothetical protein [Chitinivibrionales bacterium]
MSASLKNFKDELQESLLTLLWQQWCLCGVQGHADEPGNWCIDPEILILLTCSIGRREPRMFDEMLDWLESSPGMINLQRLKFLAKSNSFIGKKALPAVAGFLDEISGKDKWTLALKTLLEPVQSRRPLFFFKDGRPMESFGKPDPTFKKYGFLRGSTSLRGLVGPFALKHPACLILRLRSFLGTTSRSGICIYLCTHPSGPGENPSHIAKEIGHAQRAVQDALVSMSKSGYITRREHKRDTLYAITPEMRDALFQDLREAPIWCNWIPVAGFLEKIWSIFDSNNFLEADPMVRSIKLQEVVDNFKIPISKSGLPVMLDSRGHLEGKEYVGWLVEKVKEIMKVLVTGGKTGK